MKCLPLGVGGHVLLVVHLQISQVELLSIRVKVLGPKPTLALSSEGI